MVALEPSLYALDRNGKIIEDRALDLADSRTDLSLRLRLQPHRHSDTSSLHGVRPESAQSPASVLCPPHPVQCFTRQPDFSGTR